MIAGLIAQGDGKTLADILLNALGSCGQRRPARDAGPDHALVGFRVPGASDDPLGRAGSWRVAFDGWIGNRAELRRSLDLGELPSDAELYAAALSRWGSRADTKVQGNYAAVALSSEAEVLSLRLARSPYSAPPLHFVQKDGVLAASSLHTPLLALERESPLLELEQLARMAALDGGRAQAGWYEGIESVPLGTAVVLGSSGGREVCWKYRFRPIRPARALSDAEVIAQADRLFGDAVAGACAGFARPAIALSGGLDSPLVAAAALEQRPDIRLRAFTIAPEVGWRDATPSCRMGDESERAARFARHHSRIDYEILRGSGGDPRDGLNELLRLARCAPPAIGIGWQMHALWRAARSARCDLVLTGDSGDDGLSADGEWAYREFFLSGRWGQLLALLRSRRGDPRPLWRKFASLVLRDLLPARTGAVPAWFFAARGLAPATVARLGLPRARSLAHLRGGAPRALPRRALARFIHERADLQTSVLYKTLEAATGIPWRDPLAYPPLMEFCLSLPSAQFVRDGERRYLARRLARARLPEAQRNCAERGVTFADWHTRIHPVRHELADEFERLESDADIAAVYDCRAIAERLRSMPDTPTQSVADRLFFTSGMPSALAGARMIALAKGRNMF